MGKGGEGLRFGVLAGPTTHLHLLTTRPHFCWASREVSTPCSRGWGCHFSGPGTRHPDRGREVGMLLAPWSVSNHDRSKSKGSSSRFTCSPERPGTSCHEDHGAWLRGSRGPWASEAGDGGPGACPATSLDAPIWGQPRDQLANRESPGSLGPSGEERRKAVREITGWTAPQKEMMPPPREGK